MSIDIHPQSAHGLIDAAGGIVLTGGGVALTSAQLAKFVVLVSELIGMEYEKAIRQTWQMVDPLKPAGAPGSYARGRDDGIAAALTTLRANLKTPNV
mgnify:CR=1 FL=1